MKIFAPEFEPFLMFLFFLFIVIFIILAAILYIPSLGWSWHLYLKFADLKAGVKTLCNDGQYRKIIQRSLESK